MERWVIKKTTETYKSGPGYGGATCERACVEPGKIYDDKAKAQKDADCLTEYNGIGFKVVMYRVEKE